MELEEDRLLAVFHQEVQKKKKKLGMIDIFGVRNSD